MNLPDFRNHEELNRLRKLMGANYVPFEKEIDIKPLGTIEPVIRDKFNVDLNGILEHQGHKVVLYIRDWRGENDWNKYHVVNCKWIQEMQRNSRYSRYVNGKLKDGKFPVNRPNHAERELLSLSICQFCLEQLELKYSSAGRNVYVYKPNEFPLSDWFDAIDDGYEPLPIDRIKSDGNYYIAAWKFLSWVCRKNADWRCQSQKCEIELGHERSDRRFLHAHHTKGTRYNKPEDLKALCIGCHAEEPGEGHQRLKRYAEYQEFMEKFGEKWKHFTN